MGSVVMNPVAKAWGYGYAAGTVFYKFAVSIDPDYGYDLVTTYGAINASEFGYNPVEFVPPLPSGQGYVENPDGTYTDANGNIINLDTTPWYWFDGDCLFDDECY